MMSLSLDAQLFDFLSFPGVCTGYVIKNSLKWVRVAETPNRCARKIESIFGVQLGKESPRGGGLPLKRNLRVSIVHH